MAIVAHQQTATLFAIPQFLELSFLRQQIHQGLAAGAHKMYMKQPACTDSPAPVHLYDEFGVASTCSRWIPKPMFAQIIEESKASQSAVQELLFEFGPDEPPKAEDVYYIDMTHLSAFRK